MSILPTCENMPGASLVGHGTTGLKSFGTVVVAIVTAPYRRTFTLYTWKTLKQLREADGDRSLFAVGVKQFKEEKYKELQSVQVASSLSTGATLAVITWTKIPHPIWAVEALWLCSLICSLWAVITSIQTRSLLDDLPENDRLHADMDEHDFKRAKRVILRYERNPGFGHWVMMFLWQFPSMTMSYAWCTFLSGLTIYVCTPFIRHEGWNNDCKVAVAYLSVSSVGFFSYLFSSVFVYAGERDSERSPAILDFKLTRQDSVVNQRPFNSSLGEAMVCGLERLKSLEGSQC